MHVRNCVPGSSVQLNCTLAVGAKTSEVVRVCESSRRLGCGTACRGEEALSLGTVAASIGWATVAFACPASRAADDPLETGGAYSIYAAAVFAPLASTATPTVVCNVV